LYFQGVPPDKPVLSEVEGDLFGASIRAPCCVTRSSPASPAGLRRGETETLDKMRARVQYDIDYMRNGSLGFDLMIIGKTLAVVWRDQNAY